MKRRFLSYTYVYIVLLGLLAAACQSDLNGLLGGQESDGQSISVAVDIPEVRTRAIDMNPGSAVHLKNIWIGVYDRGSDDGRRVGGTGKGNKGTVRYTDEIDLGDYLAASGNTIIDLVKIGYEQSLNANDDRYCVVGVANYHGIKVISQDGKEKDLYAALEEADTWASFKDIAIDTRNSTFELQTPVLVGYMEDISGDAPTTIANNGYIKVDQTGSGSIDLFGQGKDSYVFLPVKNIGTNWWPNNVLDTENYVLKLRRMRSKINVSVNEPDAAGNNPAPNITITNLAYKVFNNPGSAYLMQRRTNTFGTNGNTDPFNGKTAVQYSPNSSDVQNDYFDDENWTMPPISTNFSFEHFENKHWAKNTTGLNTYHDREKNDGNGLFNVLAENTSDWNNNASYFVLKMNIRDEKTGKNGEIYYTIHEGFINDADGNDLTDVPNSMATRLQDFSCVRNTEYFYKITVRGIDDIDVQVSTERPHPNDQQGNIWKMNYAVPSNVQGENYVESKNGETFDYIVKVKEDGDKDFKNADVALRLVGSYYDEARRMEIPVDLCYNFKQGSLDGFASLWPSPTNAYTEYIVETGEKTAYVVWKEFYNGGNGENENAKNLSQFIDKVKVKVQGTVEGADQDGYITINEYIERLQDDTKNPNILGYKVEGYKYYVAFDPDSDNKRDHLRGLYVFDKEKAFTEGIRVLTDADDEYHKKQETAPCTYIYQINAMEQFPYYLETEEYKMIYANGNSLVENNPNPSKELIDFKNDYSSTGTGTLLTEHPDMAFRLLGYDGNTKDYYDFFYNVGLNEYSTFYADNSWPQKGLNGTDPKVIAKGYLSSGVIPQSFLDGIQIMVNDNSHVYDIESFIRNYENGSITLSSKDKLGFRVNQYPKIAKLKTGASPKPYMRALYLFDRKNKFNIPAIYSADDNSATFLVYAAEQAPKTENADKLQLPGNLPTNYSSTNKYNIIDPYLDAIRIPVIKDAEGVDIPYSDYRYRVRATSTYPSSTAYSYVDINPQSGYYNFNIPMHSLPGDRGNISVMAESFSDDYYDSNYSGNLGSYTLQPPPEWHFNNSGNDLYNAYQNVKNNGGEVPDTYNFNGSYLSFSGKFKAANNYDGFLLQGASSLITFKIYKPCSIKFTTSSSGSSTAGLVISLNDREVNRFANPVNNQITIREADFNGKDVIEVSIKRYTGSTYLRTIQVIP